MEFCLVLTTTSKIEEAKTIAHALVENKLAACVNIVPKIISVYEWKNEVNEDDECLLVIKTKKIDFDDIKKTILDIHSYELPEIIMLPIEAGLDGYLNWIRTNTER